jgi:mRNA-degrading endonuclease toxin of MazEF toxin-antitoxin module
MEKDFDKWNTQKKFVDLTGNKKVFHEREVWFIAIGENIGFEQNGKGEEFLRPVIIYKKFSRNVFLGIPLTKTKREGKFYADFELHGKTSTAILSQVRLFDSKRLKYKIGKMSVGDYRKIKEKLIELIQ